MTAFYGVLGHPVAHSLSPAMHEAAYRRLRLDAQYAAFDVEPRELRRAVAALRALGVRGVNVTVPLKEAAWRLCNRRTPAARVLRAVNVLTFRSHGIEGDNTDAAGWAAAVRRATRRSWRGARTVVLGAGGAARAVVWALAQWHPAEIHICNRTASRSRQLQRALAPHVGRTRLVAHGLSRRDVREAVCGAQLLVNATSVGLSARDASPVPAAVLSRGMVVFDLVYHRTTALQRSARRRGALTLDGVDMLVYQGAAAFERWWHRPAPVSVMRAAVRRALAAQRRGGER